MNRNRPATPAPAASRPPTTKPASLRTAFGHHLRLLRHHRVMSQKTLAAACGVSLNTIGSIERGLRFPSPEVLELLARALEVEVRDLFDIGEHAAPATLEGAARELGRVIESELLPQIQSLTALANRLLLQAESQRADKPGDGIPHPPIVSAA
ncbi:MAG: helix-turn-helix transcriptional regulator [Deltaproteobacteria bacterium]|nr:helix-turn-helix transcriptional regulator [Deltaproteobacteria bacterium]